MTAQDSEELDKIGNIRDYRAFISFTREDEDLAILLVKHLRAAFWGRRFEAQTMKDFEAGREWRKDLRKFLTNTDLLITIFTGQQKDSHSWTGWEVGFFSAKTEEKPSRFTDPAIPRAIVPINFLGRSAPVTDTLQAIKIEFTTELDKSLSPDNIKYANLTINDLKALRDVFERRLKVTKEDPLFQLYLMTSRNVSTLEGRQHQADDEEHLKSHVVSFYMDVHDLLRNRPRIDDALETKIIMSLEGHHNIDKYPPDIDDSLIELLSYDSTDKDTLIKLDQPERKLTWGKFWKSVEEKYSKEAATLWKNTIIDLIRSAEGDEEVDRSQTLVSSDGATLYRALITRKVLFFGGRREYHIYIFRALRRKDYGDEETSTLMKSILVACRYRFMMLEPTSPFRPDIFEGLRRENYRVTIIRMMSELDRIIQESAEAGLTVVQNTLLTYLDPTAKNRAEKEWHRAEKEMREKALAFLLKDIQSQDDFESTRGDFATTYKAFCEQTRKINKEFLSLSLKRLDSRIHALEKELAVADANAKPDSQKPETKK